MSLVHETLTGAVIGAAIEVHTTLGPGFIESVYEEALVIELARRGIAHARQVRVPIRYRDLPVGMHQLDLFVDDAIVVELKAVKSLTNEHFAVVRPYLRAVDRQHGLLLNFAQAPLEIRRVMTRQ